MGDNLFENFDCGREIENSGREQQSAKENKRRKKELTAEAGVIRLDKGLFDNPIHDDERVPLTTEPAKDGRAIEGKVERLGKARRGVAKEADLRSVRRLETFGGREGLKNAFWGRLVKRRHMIEKQG